jgi:hypothetical protein
MGTDERCISSLTDFALWLLVVFVAIGSLTPFGPLISAEETLSRLTAALKPSLVDLSLAEIGQRLLAFLPAGILARWRLLDNNRRKSFGIACFWTFLFVAVIEVGQVFVPSRHPRLTDLLIGFAAVTAGAWMGKALQPWREAVGEVYRRRWRVVIIALLLVWEAALLSVSVIAHRGVQLEGWHRGYPLLVANELTRDRPWRGTISHLVIYSQELGPAKVAQLERSPVPASDWTLRRALGAVAAYRFAEPDMHVFRQQIPEGPQIPLLSPEGSLSNLRLADAGVEFLEPTVIRSPDSAAELSEVCESAGAFSVEVAVEIKDLSQRGPARIVSVSQNPSERNFTLGQEGRNIDFRVRTPRMGDNGSRVPCRTRSGPLYASTHRIVATFGRGSLSIYQNGQLVRRPLRLYFLPSLLFRADWLGTSVAAALILFLPLGYLGGLLIRNDRDPGALLLMIAATTLPPVVLSWGLTAAYDRDQDHVFLVVAILACALGALKARGRGSESA